jgi:hypothetical protein
VATVLGLAGAVLLAMGVGLGVAPAVAGTGDSVTPSVSFRDPDCDDQTAGWAGYVDGHPDSGHDGVRFAVTAGAAHPSSKITVTATAEAGVVFSGGDTSKTFSHTYADAPADCGDSDVVVTPGVVFHNPDSQDQTASWAGYVNGAPDSAGDGVTFAVTAGTVAPGHSVTVTATAQAGYVFPGGKTTKSFCHTFNEAPGSQVVTVTATVQFHNPDSQDQTASWAGFVNGAPDSAGDGVRFAVTAGAVAPGATVTITATAEAGHAFAGGETTKAFTHTFAQTTGEVATVVPTVKFRNPTAQHTAGWTGYVDGAPDSAGDGVTFTVTAGAVAPGATVKITATAEAGYVFPGGDTTMTFTHRFSASGSGNAGGNGGGGGSGGSGTGAGGTGSGSGSGSDVVGTTDTSTSSGSGAGSALAGQSTLPTSVEAGQAGDEDEAAIPMGLAASLLGAGTLLLMASGWATIRKPRAGAHRA